METKNWVIGREILQIAIAGKRRSVKTEEFCNLSSWVTQIVSGKDGEWDRPSAERNGSLLRKENQETGNWEQEAHQTIG